MFDEQTQMCSRRHMAEAGVFGCFLVEMLPAIRRKGIPTTRKNAKNQLGLSATSAELAVSLPQIALK